MVTPKSLDSSNRDQREESQPKDLQAFEEHQRWLAQFKNRIWKPHPDSVELIRQMREGSESGD
jgi:hypothetical protein